MWANVLYIDDHDRAARFAVMAVESNFRVKAGRAVDTAQEQETEQRRLKR